MDLEADTKSIVIENENNGSSVLETEQQTKKILKSITNYTALNDEILSHRLSDVIGRYCHLQNEGAGRKKCRCPFHHEKTPSFHLDDNKGLWHCFGCGEGGNIFTFIQKIKGCDFPRAVDELCDIFGIDKKKYIVYQDVEEVEKSKNFYQTMEIVAEFYKENLQNNQEALDYLHIIRGLDNNILEEFGFGLADNDINKILDFCKNRGANEQNLIDCGIIKESQNSMEENKKYLFFRDRIIIPIHNAQGKIVAFGGRIYKSGDENAKYLNSSENWYFKKGNLLFNFNRAKKHLNKDNYLIIVEGYMDAIALYSHGFTTAIAPLGTSITENHLKTILSYSQQPVFLFDSDNAGQKASMRACDMLFSFIKVGVLPKFCTLSGAKDADEFLKKYTKQDLEEQLQNALNINTFLFENKAKNFTLTDPNQIAILQKEIFETNRKITDDILRENYKIFFTEKLNEIKEKNKNNLWKKSKNKQFSQNVDFKSQQNKPTTNIDSLDFLEKQIVAFVLMNYENYDFSDFFDNILPRLKQSNQSIFTNLTEKQDEKLIQNFCKRYLKFNDFIAENDDKNKILQNLVIKWELLKIENSNMSVSLKLEEKKKILENKKKMLIENEQF